MRQEDRQRVRHRDTESRLKRDHNAGAHILHDHNPLRIRIRVQAIVGGVEELREWNEPLLTTPLMRPSSTTIDHAAITRSDDLLVHPTRLEHAPRW